MMIHIFMDGEAHNAQPYMVVKTLMECKQEVIRTYCLDFFSFDTLEKGYDVIVVFRSGYIQLSELLDNTGEYTDKEIRKAHNVHKMLVAGAFKFKPHSLIGS